MGNVGDSIYSGAASFGVIWAFLGAIFGTLFGIAAIAGGIYILAHKNVNKISVQAKILRVNGDVNGKCEKSNETNYSCTITIQYTYDNKQYTKDVDYNGPRSYYASQTITVLVDPDNPNDVDVNEPLPKWVGIVTILFGIAIIAGGWFWYWASRKWKFVAAAEGVGGVLGIATGGRL